MLFCGAWEREEQNSANIATENMNIIGGVMPRSTRVESTLLHSRFSLIKPLKINEKMNVQVHEIISVVFYIFFVQERKEGKMLNHNRRMKESSNLISFDEWSCS